MENSDSRKCREREIVGQMEKSCCALTHHPPPKRGVRLLGQWDREIKTLAEFTEITFRQGKAHLRDPNGIPICLETGTSFELSGEPGSILGNFAGLSLETAAFSQTVSFWEILGYQRATGGETQGWMTLEKEDSVSVSIMQKGSCPHLFFSPSLTYFNGGKNLENIAKIRDAGIEITQELDCFNDEGIVDNVIVRDPGGTGLFIFND